MRKTYPFIAVALLASCSAQPAPAQQSSGVLVRTMDEDQFLFYRDPITGCEYILFRGGNATGSLTPRYEHTGRWVKGCDQ